MVTQVRKNRWIVQIFWEIRYESILTLNVRWIGWHQANFHMTPGNEDIGVTITGRLPIVLFARRYLRSLTTNETSADDIRFSVQLQVKKGPFGNFVKTTETYYLYRQESCLIEKVQFFWKWYLRRDRLFLRASKDCPLLTENVWKVFCVKHFDRLPSECAVPLVLDATEHLSLNQSSFPRSLHL